MLHCRCALCSPDTAATCSEAMRRFVINEISRRIRAASASSSSASSPSPVQSDLLRRSSNNASSSEAKALRCVSAAVAYEGAACGTVPLVSQPVAHRRAVAVGGVETEIEKTNGATALRRGRVVLAAAVRPAPWVVAPQLRGVPRLDSGGLCLQRPAHCLQPLRQRPQPPPLRSDGFVRVERVVQPQCFGEGIQRCGLPLRIAILVRRKGVPRRRR
jgi:hypothetical protein